MTVRSETTVKLVISQTHAVGTYRIITILRKTVFSSVKTLILLLYYVLCKIFCKYIFWNVYIFL